MRTIDCHAHIYTQREAVKLRARHKDRPFRGNLRLPSLLDSMKTNGIEMALILPVVTPIGSIQITSNRVTNKNVDIGKKLRQNGNLVSFGALHPFVENLGREMGRIIKYGFKGVKIHTAIQNIDPLSQRMYEIYSALQENGLIILFDTYSNAFLPEETITAPSKLAKIMSDFPNLTIIAAHLGGWPWGRTEEIRECLIGNRVYLDTAAIKTDYVPEEYHRENARSISRDEFAEIILAHGENKILFGSDWPWYYQETAIEKIVQLPLPENVKEMIFGINAIRLLKI